MRLFAKWNRVRPTLLCLPLSVLISWLQKQYAELSERVQKRGGCILPLALVGNPDIVFLDEPTAGLDVEGRQALHSLIRHPLKAKGKTILLASHDMTEG